MKRKCIITTIISVVLLALLSLPLFSVLSATDIIEDDKDTNFFTYTGTRTVVFNSIQEYNGGVSQISAAAGGVQFTFEGTAFYCYFTREIQSGQVEVYIDGQYITTINNNSNTTSYRQLMYQNTTLSPDKHLVFLRNVGNTVNTNQTGRFQLDYVQYTPLVDTQSFTQQRLVFIQIALLSIIAVVALIKVVKS